ncbi:myocardin-related transcription factor B-like isoform X1 [Carassius carassius]|uniref:myocardin-related transcription factor B-like isoform X1 n=1 Tax=Carassius carassius TaxID=217509 RepID=UPI002868FB62|nr:myocardin-related transcription factor B-like isoform X1 [Carassius carassius]XP_059414636.1 myocardin-related transcription factor B-like isoform X1 [Carassius carassius]XP_059414637.1 myocardin-related transcription factor B-like isoform X1 [Carassius carassius]
MEPQESLGVEGDSGVLGVLVPSPWSEAVTHDLEELSLQPTQNLPPIKERKNVLQLRLQQRRTREQLADQGIMPPLKTPGAFHGQVRSLERARTENFLKHKIRSRPNRAELVRMHILQETHAEPSLQATQMKLKRARLADDLNEKISQRPGPMELVEKNILPVDIVGELDVYNFNEDSSEALSPEQPASHESQGSACSPVEARLPEPSSVSSPTGSKLQLCPPTTQSSDFLNRTSAEDGRVMTAIQLVTAATPTKPGPTLVKQSQHKQSSDKSRSKKSREPKPRIKKLKYHQYIPPDQKQEPNEAPMDSAYARLLQQQQQFLQLQILSQQQQHYNYQTILPAPLKPVAESQNSCPNITLSTSPSLPAPIVVSLLNTAPSHPNHTVTGRKTGCLPTNLDEMKVAELKMELKWRGLPVSGTKTDLIERLKAHQESSQSATTMDTNISKAPLQPESMGTTPPISPEQSEASNISMEDCRNGPTKALCMLSPARPPAGTSPLKPTPEDMTMDIKVSEKDQRLHEKERQIEELMRKLEQEQRLVEELKMQLEVEKRSQQGGGQQPEPNRSVQVKEEIGTTQSCNSKQSPLPQTTGVKQEEPHAQLHHTPVQQFYINTQQVPQVLHQKTLINTQPATQILLPISLSNNPISTQAQTILQPTLPSIIQTPLLQTQMFNNTILQQHSSQTPSPPQDSPICGSYRQNQNQNQNQPMADIPQSFLNNSPRHTNGPINKPPSPCQLNYIFQPSTFPNHHSPRSKDPPRYEEAVKQTRGLQATMQVPTATSQHMDDLFDILIESGEISPLSRQDASLDKLLPVTANITTLPINTVLSRPPPQIHVARRPNQTQAPPSNLEALASDNQLLNQLLERPHSPMDTSDLTFTDTLPSTLTLQDAGLDNMEWLDLTLPGRAGLCSPTAVFSSDFLDSTDLQLHWD